MEGAASPGWPLLLLRFPAPLPKFCGVSRIGFLPFSSMGFITGFSPYTSLSRTLNYCNWSQSAFATLMWYSGRDTRDTCCECRDLPSDVVDFKKKWSQLFPRTFDTKLLAETHEALAHFGAPATLKGRCEKWGDRSQVFLCFSATRLTVFCTPVAGLCELMVATSVGGLPEGSRMRRLRFQVEPLEGTTWRWAL